MRRLQAYARRARRAEMVLAMPMARDIEPGRDPDAVEAGDIVEKPHETRGAARPAGEAAMQADRHHFRRALAFGVEHVEAVAQISEEIVAVGEALRIDEAHVVGIERIGNDQMRRFRPAHPIGQIVGIGIGRIEKAAVGEHELERVRGAAAGVPAERPFAGRLGVQADRLAHVRGFVGVAKNPCSRSISGRGWRSPSRPRAWRRRSRDCGQARSRRRTRSPECCAR